MYIHFGWLSLCTLYVVRKVIFYSTRWSGLSRNHITKQEGSQKLQFLSVFLSFQAVKYPKSAYRYLQLLIGQKFDSPLVQKYKEWFPFYDLKKDEERGKYMFLYIIVHVHVHVCVWHLHARDTI